MSAPAAPTSAVAGADGGPAVASASTALSATPLGALRRGRFWIVFAAIVVAAALLVFLVQGGGRPAGPALGSDNPAPTGAMALAEVLRRQGVQIVAVDSLDAALAAAGEGGDATILLVDDGGLLDADELGRLATEPADLVVVAPTVGALAGLADGVRLRGLADGAFGAPGCGFAPAVAAGTLPDGLATLSIDAAAAADGWTGCFPDGDDGLALATRAGPSGRVSLVPSPELFANGTITRDGSAALALGLLGAHERLVWYLPGLADADGAAAPTLGELTPPWVTPALVLLVLVAVAAGVVAGRRFGPLVVEPLPVEVPAAETALGRARLYERSAARRHALDQLRLGALRRLAARLRLGAAASVDEVIAATAAATGRPHAETAALLVGTTPRGDAELAALARRLAALEDEAARAVEPGGPPSPGGQPSRVAHPGRVVAGPADRARAAGPGPDRPAGPGRARPADPTDPAATDPTDPAATGAEEPR